MNLLKISDLSEDKVKKIFATADEAKLLRRDLCACIAETKVLANLFFEPSTRTRLSFDTAMKGLGGQVISVENGESSSTKKGETLYDTLMTVAQYADVIVTRTNDRLDAKELKSIPVPVINGGDGKYEHPTQALLDFYTIRSYFKDHFSILFLGDLKYGRTVHSLMQLLARYDCKIYHHCPENLPPYLVGLSEEAKPTEWKTVLSQVDVVYCCREQKERTEYDVENYAAEYGLADCKPRFLKEDAIVLHPLPRGEEIPTHYDNDHRSKYFEQAKNGVYVRMGILIDALEM